MLLTTRILPGMDHKIIQIDRLLRIPCTSKMTWPPNYAIGEILINRLENPEVHAGDEKRGLKLRRLPSYVGNVSLFK